MLKKFFFKTFETFRTSALKVPTYSKLVRLNCQFVEDVLKIISFTIQKIGFPLRISSVNVTKCVGRLRIWSYLLKKSLVENFIFCAVIRTNAKKNSLLIMFTYTRFSLSKIQSINTPSVNTDQKFQVSKLQSGFAFV